MIIGSAQSGKTNLLQTIIRGVAEKFNTPQEVNLYIIDFGFHDIEKLCKFKSLWRSGMF